MRRLYVVVEGQSEEAFVKGLLGPHLLTRDVLAEPIIVATSRESGGRKRKGGGLWKRWRDDLDRVLYEQAPGGAWVTTMFDLYGLPKDFPDLPRIQAAATPALKVQAAETALRDAWAELDVSRRFLPYIQCHEYEALVLACLDDLARILDAPEDLRGLKNLQEELGDIPPEHVDDGVQTSPSRRLERHIPGYDKVLHGELALWNTSMSVLMDRCPHFGEWVRRLERLG